MDDELLTGTAALVGVVLASVAERLLHTLAIDGDGGLIGVLLDDREQVREKPALEVAQLARLGFDLFRNWSPS